MWQFYVLLQSPRLAKMQEPRLATPLARDSDRTLAAHLRRPSLVTLFEVLTVELHAQDAAAEALGNDVGIHATATDSSGTRSAGTASGLPVRGCGTWV